MARASFRCPYCHESVSGLRACVACASCLAPHHEECFEEGRGCSACSESFALGASRGTTLTLALACALLSLGFAAGAVAARLTATPSLSREDVSRPGEHGRGTRASRGP